MSLAEVMSAVAALPKTEQRQVLSYLQTQVAVEESPSHRKPITRPEDNCPLSDEEIRAGAGDFTGRTLDEILRSRGLR
ncbi:MAG: hypothetical protein ACKVP0_09845 [Pirellulaceae bacterium]